MVMTERARRRLAEMVNVDGDSIAGAAEFFGVGCRAANQAVADHNDPVMADPDRLARVTAIGWTGNAYVADSGIVLVGLLIED